MPTANNTRRANEHLVFVKNVPGYLAKDTIPKLFVQYNPIGVKNVYPRSSITTVVISFATKREALHAQQETDQMRLDNVILRVEGYNKQQSVRYLRDQGQANRPLGSVEGDDTECYDEPFALQEASADTPPPEPVAAKDPKIASAGTTWAHIAGNQPGTVQPTVPAIHEANEEADAPTPPKTPVHTPRLPVAVPDFTRMSKFPPLMAQNALLPTPPSLSQANRTIVPATARTNFLNTPPRESTQASLSGTSKSESIAHLPVLPSSSNEIIMPAPPITPDNAQDDADVEHKVKMEEVSDWAQKSTAAQVTSTWEPIDTTERIRYRHSCGCWFCKRRMQS
jgi:hypothetical protein